MQHDLLGAALKDYHFSPKTFKTGQFFAHSDVDGRTVYHIPYFFRDFDAMPVIEQLALQECRGSILEVGAGAGNHLVYLQQKGFDVTAVEISGGATEVLKDRGIEKVYCADIFRYKTDQKFDTILLMMNGLGLSGNLNGLKRLLQKLKTLLALGGQILFDASDVQDAEIYEDGAMAFDLSAGHHASVVYCFEYKGVLGKNFNWLYLDYLCLSETAESLGFKADCLHAETNAYLCRLTV